MLTGLVGGRQTRAIAPMPFPPATGLLRLAYGSHLRKHVKNWFGEFDSLLNELDKNVRGVARAVRSAFDDGPFQILAYRGYGNGRVAYIHGRAQ